MSEKHKCFKCFKKFDTKFNLERHLNRKTPCNEKKEDNICNICEKEFKSKTGLDYHKNKKNPCKPISEILKKENKKLQEQILQLNNIKNEKPTYKDLEKENKNLKIKLNNNITSVVTVTNDTENGVVYLVQPEELFNTNRYKFGYSTKDTLNRTKSYGSNTKYILVYSSDKAKELETYILDVLSKLHVKIKNEIFEIGDVVKTKHLILNECISFEMEK